jgi:hypothetical protein
MEKLNEFLNRLDEYIGIFDKGKIDMGMLDLRLITLSSKDEARRLAHRLIKEATPEELKKALKLAKTKSGSMVHWFVEAVEELAKVPAKA